MAEGVVELRHGRMALSVDAGTGSILRVGNTQTGQVHIDAGRDGHADGRLFRLMVPDDFWWSRYADSQNQTEVNCTEVDGGLTLEYPDLVAADGVKTGIRVVVDIRPSAKSDEFAFSMQIENNGPFEVLDTAFPQLGGWYDDDEAKFAIGANAIYNPRELSPPAGNNYARNGRRMDWIYPVFMATPWVDLYNSKGGLSLINNMAEGLNGRFCADNLDAYGDDFRIMVNWSHMAVVQSGESWSTPPMLLGVHEGDWRSTADQYTKWFDALNPPDYSRPKIRSRIGFQNTFFRGFDGTPVNPLEEIPQAAADARKYGVDMLCVWDTQTLGNYARADAHDLTDYPPEDREKLVKGLQQAEAEGSSTCALTNFRHPNVALHLPDPDLPNQVQKRYVGTFRTENWSANHTMGAIFAYHIGPESYVFSPFSDAHKERIDRVSREYRDLGYTSMFYDQPFEHQLDYGRIADGHQPATTHTECLKNAGIARKVMLEGDPNAIMIGEETDIHACSVIDQWMTWSIAEPSPESLARVTMLRYSLPHTIMSWVIDHQPERASLAFTFGMQMCLMVHGAEATLAAEPAFAEHVRMLSDLRKKTADRTVMARFRGHEGLTIEGDDAFVALRYESTAGPAVIVTAAGESAKGTVTVETGTQTAEGQVFGLNGSLTCHTGTTCEFDLGTNDVAVWIL
jgi:hypothetical protein